jgi:hypothetical protein
MTNNLFLKPLFCLWIGIAAVRVLIHIALVEHLPKLSLNIVSLLFVLAVPATELFILFRAAREYQVPNEVTDRILSFYGRKQKNLRARSTKFMLILFMFCLPYGLWTMRNDPDLIMPTLFGSAINLFLTANMTLTLLRFMKASERLQEAGCPKSQS